MGRYERMNWNIRQEYPSDYYAITELHALTFSYSYGMGEAVLVNILRARSTFDPELSLVCELDGQIIGHILFTPQPIRIQGSTYQGLILSPLAVHPNYQKQGIGSALIEAGHHRALHKDFALSVVLGHPHYYVRFGYQGKAWMDEQVHIPLESIYTDRIAVVRERRIELGDIPSFLLMWEHLHASSPLALIPGSSIQDWISPGAGTISTALLIDEKLSGYIRYSSTDPEKISFIVAQDSHSLLLIANYFKQKLNPLTASHLSLPLPATSYLLERFATTFDVNISTYAEYMVKILEGPLHSKLHHHFTAFEEGTVPRGSIIWPVEFDVC
ncbi:Predicted N-acetyltransferase YhbS [Paenibacillus sp. PDC88]|nr:Predicted N-acetyltransferase YhbS [Paenibacillus sp. PDC88]